MSDVRELLVDASEQPRREPDMAVIRQRVASRHRRRVVAVALATMTAVIGAVGVGTELLGDDNSAVVQVPPSGPDHVTSVVSPLPSLPTRVTTPRDLTSSTTAPAVSEPTSVGRANSEPATTTSSTVATAATTLASTGAPATTTIPTTTVAPAATTTTTLSAPSGLRTVSVRVVDGEGTTFVDGSPTVSACPTIVDEPCPGKIFSVNAGNGELTISLDPNVEYRISAGVVIDGWPGGYTWPQTGITAHTSAFVVATGATLVDGTEFVIKRPSGPPVSLRVVDGNGNPFAGNGGIQACVRINGEDCSRTPNNISNGLDTDGDGSVELYLEPDLDYQLTAFAVNTGWCNSYDDGGGTTWSFGNNVVATAVSASGMTLVLANPCA